MRILFIADGRSPIALNWISYFFDKDVEVHLATTYDCIPEGNFASVQFIPVAFSQAKKKAPARKGELRRINWFWGSPLVKFRTSFRRIFFPLTLRSAADQLKELISSIQPDIAHAMRIPFEGILTSRVLRNTIGFPLVISVWGNDFTLHAGATPWMKRYTSGTLARTNGLHTDCHRDLQLAYQWGYPEEGPALVVPGNGGVQSKIFHPPKKLEGEREHIVINPRGVRSYIRNDTFFAAIPIILNEIPGAKFICLGMEGDQEINRLINNYGVRSAVTLFPDIPRDKVADQFRNAAVAVSPSTHDGTPNTLLEAMACGSFPVVGDLQSLREWINPGVNGLLIDPADPAALAEAVIAGLKDAKMRQDAANYNHELIMQRAEYQNVMSSVYEFYRSLIL